MAIVLSDAATNALSNRPGAPARLLRGLDVGDTDNVTDWEAARRAGASFGMAKCSDACGWANLVYRRKWPSYDGNRAGLRAAGLVGGAYHFPRTWADWQPQIDKVIEFVRHLAPGELPPMIDIETQTWNEFNGQPPDPEADPGGCASPDHRHAWTAAEWVANLGAWLTAVEKALGRTPIIYLSTELWNTRVNSDDFGRYPLCTVDARAAQIASGVPRKPNRSWQQWTFWQYGDVGEDLDCYFGTLHQLRGLADLGAITVANGRLCYVEPDATAGSIPGDTRVVTVGGAPASVAPSVRAAGNPFAVPGSDDILFRGTDDHIYHAWLDGAVWRVENASDGAFGDPVGFFLDGALHAVYRTGDDRLRELVRQPDGSWTQSDLFGGAAVQASGELALYVRNGVPRVVVRTGSDGNLGDFVRGSDGNWLGRDLAMNGLAATYRPVLYEVGGALRVAFRGVDGLAHELPVEGEAALPYQEAPPAGAGAVAGTPAVYVDDQGARFVYRATDGHLHLANWAGGSDVSARWVDVDLYSANPAGVDVPLAAADPVSWGDGTSIHIAYRTPDGPLCDLVLGDGGGWQPTQIPSP